MFAYPDIEPFIVSTLTTWLDDPSVRVATRKKPPADTEPPKQVIVTVAYSNEKPETPLLRYAGVVIDVFATDYAAASNLE